MNSSLVPRSYYSVAPEPGPNILDNLLGYGVAAGDAINGFAYNQAPGSIGRVLLGADRNTQMGLERGLGKLGSMVPGVAKNSAFRFASSAPVRQALRVVPGLSAAGALLSAGDIVLGDDSIGNKAMDTAAMGIGGFLGAAGGPIGIAAGASLGKAVSDGAQWLFGDKKTPEQRKMELALQQLQGGGMF